MENCCFKRSKIVKNALYMKKKARVPSRHTVSKIVERAAHIQLYNHLDSNGLLHVKQFGFHRKRSTSSALLQFSDDILQNMEDGLVTGVVFLDLKKAFDTVNHRVLLFKLRALGVDDSAAA